MSVSRLALNLGRAAARVAREIAAEGPVTGRGGIHGLKILVDEAARARGDILHVALGDVRMPGPMSAFDAWNAGPFSPQIIRAWLKALRGRRISTHLPVAGLSRPWLDEPLVYTLRTVDRRIADGIRSGLTRFRGTAYNRELDRLTLLQLRIQAQLARQTPSLEARRLWRLPPKTRGLEEFVAQVRRGLEQNLPDMGRLNHRLSGMGTGMYCNSVAQGEARLLHYHDLVSHRIAVGLRTGYRGDAHEEEIEKLLALRDKIEAILGRHYRRALEIRFASPV